MFFESSYKITNANNFMICLNDNIQSTIFENTVFKNEDINSIMKSSNENDNIQSTIPESINTIIKSSDDNDILKIVYPDDFLKILIIVLLYMKINFTFIVLRILV